MIARFLGWLIIFLLGTSISLTSLHTHLSTYRAVQQGLTKVPNLGIMGPMRLRKTCSICRAYFDTVQPKAKYCSNKCRRRAEYEPVGHGLSKGTVGAIAELRVSSELLLKNYEVFRALSPNSSCDLAILKNGKLIRVEVRTGYVNETTGNIHYSRHNVRADVVAVVLPDRIIYHGTLP